VLGAVAFLVLASTTVAASATEARSVLLIYSDPRLSPAIVAIDEAVRATIESRTLGPVQFFTEYLDLSWFPGGQEHHIGQAMADKYAGRTFDLVMPCSEGALRFALRERETLFPGVPMVFCTVEDDGLDDVDLPSDATGVTVVRDWAAGIDLILRLHPDTRRIAFVGGAGPVDRRWEAFARKGFAAYQERLTFTYLTGLPMEETVAAVAALSDDTVIVFNVFLRDGAGRPFSSPAALARLAPAAKVPIYGFAETQLGHGIVGGPLVGYETQAARAGELATRVLAGERLGPADMVRRLPYQYTFDARQLARWRIPESRLPPGSVVRFRTPSLWAEYRWYVAGAVGLVSAQTLLIAGLVVGRRRLRQTQWRLDERLRFERLLADLAAGFVEIPPGAIDERIWQGLDRTILELGMDRAGLAELSAAGEQLRVTHARSRAGVVPTPDVFTSEAWPWVLGRLRRGDGVCVARLADLPPEATSDREQFAALGTRSIVVLPLVVGGATVGGFACSTQREREWPAELVVRLRLLADIFAVVLMRRRADAALAESEKRSQVESLALRSAILGSLYGRVAALDSAGVIVAVNESWTRFTEEQGGDARTAGVGANYLDVCRRAAASGDPDAAAGLEAIEGVLAGRNARAQLEYPCATPSGRLWYMMIVEPFTRPEGGLVISHIDITRRRRAEEQVQREHEDLAHALRVATLGELATSLAHEINQPLAAIASNAQAARRLLRSAEVDPEVPAVLRDIADEAKRAAQVIRRLRALFRKEHSERRSVDLNVVLKEVLGLLRRDLERRRVRLEVVLQPDPPSVLGDIVQLQQVILNVLVNAADAMADAPDPRELRVETLVREAGILAISVRDSGLGVAPSELEHIFERFVTSKPEGLGMGLSISRSIIEAHGGRIWAARNVDRGLTVYIELPYVEMTSA
jgi:signal transduction histidine kinase